MSDDIEPEAVRLARNWLSDCRDDGPDVSPSKFTTMARHIVETYAAASRARIDEPEAVRIARAVAGDVPDSPDLHGKGAMQIALMLSRYIVETHAAAERAREGMPEVVNDAHDAIALHDNDGDGCGCQTCAFASALIETHAAAERARESMPAMVRDAAARLAGETTAGHREMTDRALVECHAQLAASREHAALIAKERDEYVAANLANANRQLAASREECERVRARAERDVYVRYSSAGREFRSRLARLLWKVKRERDTRAAKLARWTDCFICVECGRGKADEEGCCTTCGRDVLIVEGGKLTRPLSHFYDRDAIDEYTDKLEADVAALTAERDKLQAEVERLTDRLASVEHANEVHRDSYLIELRNFFAEQAKAEIANEALAVLGETSMEALAKLREEKNAAYDERNRCVAALARMAMLLGWPCGLARHPDDDASWDREWMTIVFIDFPTGQASWHVHDRDVPLFDGLTVYAREWDGHTTLEKYARLANLRRFTARER